MKYIVLLSSFIFLLAACKKSEKRYSSYFNIVSSLRADMALLNRGKAILVKTVKSDGKVDNIKSTKPDWNLELELFNKLSISSIEFEGKYQVDTTLLYPLKNDSNVVWRRVNYKALEEDLIVRYLEVEFDSKKKVRSITGSTTSSDFLTTISKSYTYYPLQSYSVNANESTLWLGESTYKVEGVIYFTDPYFE